MRLTSFAGKTISKVEHTESDNATLVLSFTDGSKLRVDSWAAGGVDSSLSYSAVRSVSVIYAVENDAPPEERA